MERTIIHLNAADFAVAVERQCDRRLQGRPVIIAANSPRAAVYDMSDEAYRSGIRKGMPLGQAVRRCREALLVRPRPERYQEAARILLQQARPYTPLVEATDSNGHLFLDVTGCGRLYGPAPDIARRIRKSVRNSLDIELIWTVAPSKLMAKLTSRLVKPYGEYIAAPGEEEKILAPCPLPLLPGLEGADILRLSQFNITIIGELAALSVAQLAVPFGRRGIYLHELARGIDRSPVLPPDRPSPAIIQSHHFADGSIEFAQVEKALALLSEQAGSQLRRQGLATGKIAITLAHIDDTMLGRQANMETPTADDSAIYTLARHLLQTAWRRRVRLASLRLACHRLAPPPPAQLDLFGGRPENKRTTLLPALDRIRQRFGENSIGWGNNEVWGVECGV